ncbi:MAG: phage minor head protein, partial [Pseudomonadota bacterium]
MAPLRPAGPPHPARIDRASPAYVKAFEAYLRYGTPIRLGGTALAHDINSETKAGRLVEDRPTTHYIWRTRGDAKVRPSHAENDGKIFAWDNPPPTGHPGEDYGCRCTAIAYVPDTSEFFNIEMQNVTDEGPSWSARDYVHHYFNGNGRTVSLRKTGNLEAVVREYVRRVINKPTVLRGQIADFARRNQDQPFINDFGYGYLMEHIVYALGKTSIGGVYRG